MGLQYNADNSYLFVNENKSLNLKPTIKMLTLQLNFEKLSLNEDVYNFSVDYKSIDKSDILNIYKYLMTKNNIKKMFCLIKQVFSVLLSFSQSLARNRIKCLFLNYERYVVRPTLIDLSPVELKYYPFMISLNKFTGSCIVLSPKICVPKEIKDINVKAINITTNKTGAKVMTGHVS